MDSSADTSHQQSSLPANSPMAGNEREAGGPTAVESGTANGRQNLALPTIQSQAKQSKMKDLIQEQLTASKRLLKKQSTTHWILLLLSCSAMMTAFPASSILTRLYYLDGGMSKWFITWLAAAGWPISAAILCLFCFVKGEYPTRPTWMVTLAYIFIGFISAADNLMFAYAYAYLPASTAALLSSSSLAFTAILAYFIVGQRFNSSSVNAVVVMSTATVILGLDSSSDRPFGVTSKQYATGFVLAIAGSALHGLIFSLSERVFMSLVGRRSFRVVLELQTATSMFATIFTTIGVLITGDFGKVHDEVEGFRLGPGAYYQVVVWTVVTFQLGVLGAVGCLFLASTLLAGVLNAARVPVTAVVAVVCFNDPMGGFKILAIVLSVWSFGSYMWGSHQDERRREKRSSRLSRSRSGSLHSIFSSV